MFTLFAVILCFSAGSEPSVYTKFDSRSGVLYISGEGELKNMYALEYRDDDFDDCEHDANELCSLCWEYDIKHLVIGRGITSIDHCFFNIYGLKTVSLPETLKEIKGGSFINCYNLRSFTLPESVTVIDNAFNECRKLEWVNIPKNIEVLCGFGGAKLSHIEIPRTVKRLALWSNTVDKIYIPETVTEKMLKVSGRINEYGNLDYKENLFTGLKITSPDFTVIGYDKSAAKKWAKNQKGCEFEQISPVPAKIKAKNYGKSIKITWEKVDKTDKWSLYRKADGEKSWTKLTTVSASTTSYSDKSVKYGKIYTYSLKGDKNKIYTKVKIGRVEAPYNLRFYATSPTSSTLTWNKVDNAKYYYIYERYVSYNPYGQNTVKYRKLAKVNAKYNYYKFDREKLSGNSFDLCMRAHDGTSYSAYSHIYNFDFCEIGITSVKADVKKNTITVKWHTAKDLKKVTFDLIFYGYKDGVFGKVSQEKIIVKASAFKTSGKYTYVTLKPKADLDSGVYTRFEYKETAEYSAIDPHTKKPYTGGRIGYILAGAL